MSGKKVSALNNTIRIVPVFKTPRQLSFDQATGPSNKRPPPDSSRLVGARVVISSALLGPNPHRGGLWIVISLNLEPPQGEGVRFCPNRTIVAELWIVGDALHDTMSEVDGSASVITRLTLDPISSKVQRQKKH